MEVLGFNPILLVAQLVSFGFLFLVLKKFLYSKIKKTLEDRREEIRQIAEKNTDAEKKLQDLELEKANLNIKNQEELRKLISESQKNADGLKKEILIEAQEKSKKIVDRSREVG